MSVHGHCMLDLTGDHLLFFEICDDGDGLRREGGEGRRLVAAHLGDGG